MINKLIPDCIVSFFTVGASQSHGKRLSAGDKGLDYLAAFSSRGPTHDGKMFLNPLQHNIIISNVHLQVFLYFMCLLHQIRSHEA